MKCTCCHQDPCRCNDREVETPDRFVLHGLPPPAEALDRSMQLLHRCATPDGFLASPTRSTNYRRVWARDGVIIGLAALMTGDHDLVTTFGRTLVTLARHQGPQGEIPSNVDTASGRVSYGGTTGRVDADLWFVIGCSEYLMATGDRQLPGDLMPALDEVDRLLRSWEFNN